MKNFALVIFFLLLFSLAGNFAYASSSMGISPATQLIIYKGAGQYSGSFTVNPQGNKNIQIYATGQLKDYVKLNGNQSNLNIHMDSGTSVDYTIDLPETMQPGEYKTTIYCEQYLTPEETVNMQGFGAVAAVGYVIFVSVPNEGKFIKADMKIEPSKINVGSIIYFTIKVLNFGTEDLSNINSVISIKDSGGKILANKQTTSIDFLPRAESGELRGFWDSKGQSAGSYSTLAAIEYGGKTATEINMPIRIGDIDIQIVNVTTELNESIGKIFVDVQSNWNELIPNVYAEIKIKNQTSVIDTVKTSSVDLEAWGKERLTAFWERKSLEPGNYDMEIYVYYYDKQTQKETMVNLPELQKAAPPKTEGSQLVLIAIILLAVILVVNMVWFFINFKNKAKKKRK